MPRPVTDRAHTPIHFLRLGTNPNPMSIMRSTDEQRKRCGRGPTAELTRYPKTNPRMTAHSRKQATHRRGTTNVYADLGYRAPESMLVKAQLVSRIVGLLAERGMTQTQAATVLGIPQPKLSKILRGQFRGFSEGKLVDCLTHLGQDVQIVVRQRPDDRSTGAVSVTFA